MDWCYWLESASDYSRRPKSGHPDFSVFGKRPVAEHVRFLNVRSIHVTMSGFRMPESQSTDRSKSGHNRPDFRRFRPKPVPNRIRTGLEPVLV